MTIRNLEALLEPRSVALIGAGTRPVSIGATVARNLLAGGFKGKLMFVNPKHSEVAGHPCFPSIAQLPETPDLAVIATPPPTVPGIIAELAARGTRAAVVITAGLDAQTRQRMLDAARPTNFRIQGPNCLGLMRPDIGLDASFAHIMAPPGDIAILSQSGALLTGIIDWAAGRGIGFSHVVSLGDMADVDFGDLLDYLAGDRRSRAILLYMEAVTSARKFMSAARRAARVKPVIVVKSGRHEGSAKAAASHTGRMAGSDAAYAAAFRRAGLLRVLALNHLFEAAEMLSRVPRLTGERLTILTNGGGAGVLAADRMGDDDGRLAVLSEETRARLDAVLPANWSHGNPVDIIGDAPPERFAAALEILLADKATDALLVMNCPTALASSTEIAARVVKVIDDHHAKARDLRKVPVLTNWLGDGAASDARKLFASHQIPTFDTPASAARAYMYLVAYNRAQEALMQTPPALPRGVEFSPAPVRKCISDALAAGRELLTEVEGKAMLAAYGIPVVETVVVRTDAEIERQSARLLTKTGGTLALKILSEDISHKSDIGGVRLNLATKREVLSVAREMRERVEGLRPGARIDGFTLSPMVVRRQSHELILGMTVDATFGPVIMFGAGGTGAEVMKDIALGMPPLDMKLARDLVQETRISRLLRGYRDRPQADCEAIAAALVSLSALVVAHPEIRELDINPLLADDKGVIALDARVRIADESKSPRVPLAIRPYPIQWERQAAHAELGPVTIRPIRPEDERLYENFAKHLLPEDIRLRFFAPKANLSHHFVARLTQIDYAREIAFIAIAQNGDMLGVSRFAADPDYETAEYAVMVRSDLKGKGLGNLLMAQLIEYAKANGLKRIIGSVLAENTGMLSMCRHLGFTVRADPDDMTVRHVELELGR